jgi:hypothetical protein
VCFSPHKETIMKNPLKNKSNAGINGLPSQNSPGGYINTLTIPGRLSLSIVSLRTESTISGSHLVETTSVVLSNRNDEATNLPQTTSMAPRRIDTAQRNGILQQARCILLSLY